MTGLAGRRAPNSYNYNYQHVAQHEDQYLSPTDTDDASSVELLDVESACKAYSHRRSRSNSSLSSILSSFAPGSAYLRSHSPRVRLSRRLLHVFVIAFLLWIILTPILNPSYLYRPYHYSGRNLRRENVFIAANIVDEDLIRGAWGNGIVELVDLLGPEHVFLSIFENDSGPGTKAALQELGERVKCKFSIVSQHIDLDDFPKIQIVPNEQRVKRIAYLAEVRNRAIAPLTTNSTGMHFDKVLFLNDVVFTPSDAADLLFSTNMGTDGATRYHAACAMDFINPFKYYDTFATRDAEGHMMGVPFFPYFTSAGEGVSRRDILDGVDTVRVKSCWGGMVAFEAKWFVQQEESLSRRSEPALLVQQEESILRRSAPALNHSYATSTTPKPSISQPPVHFRSSPEVMWEASECCLVHADISQLTALNPEPWEDHDNHDYGIYINPYIRVAYDTRSHSWLEFTRRFERLYSFVQSFVNWLVGRPPHQARRLEIPGSTVWRKDWVYTGPKEDDVDRSKIRDRALTKEVMKYGHWEDVQGVVQPGSYCGGRQLLALIPQPWKSGEKIWDRIPAPQGY